MLSGTCEYLRAVRDHCDWGRSVMLPKRGRALLLHLPERGLSTGAFSRAAGGNGFRFQNENEGMAPSPCQFSRGSRLSGHRGPARGQTDHLRPDVLQIPTTGPGGGSEGRHPPAPFPPLEEAGKPVQVKARFAAAAGGPALATSVHAKAQARGERILARDQSASPGQC